MAEVDLVIGNSEKMQQKTWAQLSNNETFETEKIKVDDIMSANETAGHLIDGFGSKVEHMSKYKWLRSPMYLHNSTVEETLALFLQASSLTK